MRTVKILSKYILKEFFGPYCFALIFLTFVLMMNQLVILFNRLVGKGLEATVIGEVFILSIPFILKRMNIDPALAGSVILTTVTDVVGFLVFLGLGTMFLL